MVSVGYYLVKSGVYFYEPINIELKKLDDNNYVGKINISENNEDGKYLISGSAKDIYGNDASETTGTIFYVGHNWNNVYTIDKESTCTEKGEKSIHCLICDAIKEDSKIELELKEHNWNEGEIIKEPTNTETGIKIYTCKECNTTRTEIIDVLKYSITGTLESSFIEDEKITIQLIKKGDAEPIYEYTSGENMTKYSFSDLLAGIYELRVMKKNHVTREYEIIINNSNITQDVKICLIGDINADGKVNNKDWNILYNHINETNKLTGYSLQCADVNNDDKINIKDWNRLYEHINEVKPLY